VVMVLVVSGCEVAEEDSPPEISPTIKEQLRGRHIPGLGTFSDGKCAYTGLRDDYSGKWRCGVTTSVGHTGFCRLRMEEMKVTEISCRRTKEVPRDLLG
jgi:hypothetical protein